MIQAYVRFQNTGRNNEIREFYKTYLGLKINWNDSN